MSLSLAFTLPVPPRKQSGLKVRGFPPQIPETGFRWNALLLLADPYTKQRDAEIPSFTSRSSFCLPIPPANTKGLIYAVYPDRQNETTLPLLVKIRILPWIRIEPATVDAAA